MRLFLTARGPPFNAVRERVFFDVKADFGFGIFGQRGHELADGLEKGTNVGIMAFDSLLQIGQLAREFFVKRERFTESDESAHDRDIDLDGLLAVENARQHRNALFSESEREVLEVLSPLQGSKLEP